MKISIDLLDKVQKNEKKIRHVAIYVDQMWFLFEKCVHFPIVRWFFFAWLLIIASAIESKCISVNYLKSSIVFPIELKVKNWKTIKVAKFISIGYMQWGDNLDLWRGCNRTKFSQPLLNNYRFHFKCKKLWIMNVMQRVAVCL